MNKTFVILKWTLRQRKWMILWWSLGIISLIGMTLAFWPSFQEQTMQIDQSFADMPEGAQALMTDTEDFTSPEGYMSSQLYYLTLPLLLGIMAISLGSSILSREEKEGTVELLLSRPISRTNLLLSKALSAVVIIGIVAGISLAFTLFMARVVDLPIALIHISTATFACWLLALSFGSIAFLISSLGKARIASVGISIVIALGGYIISSLAGLASWLENISRAFPFYYYQPGDMLAGASYHTSNMLILAAIPIIAGLIAWQAFRRRDIVVN